jgi:pteridine reductase
MPRLDASRALVIGGGRRLGRAIALGLAEHGADVAVTSHAAGADAEETAAAIRAFGRRSAALACDVRSVDEIGGAVAGAAEALGGLDVLVYAAAGGFRAARPDDVDAALFDEAVGTILRGGFFAAQAAHAQMGERGGVIVFITDVAVLEAWPHFAPHAAAKAALAQLTRSLARAFAPDVRVCAVAPGPVLLPDGSDDAVARRQASRTALGRLGAPADVVGAVAYLIEADYVTGEQLVVDGGHAL